MYRDDDAAAALKLSATEAECVLLEKSHADLTTIVTLLEFRRLRTQEELRERGFAEKGLRSFFPLAWGAIGGLLLGLVVTPDQRVWQAGLGLAFVCTFFLVFLTIAQRYRHARELTRLTKRVRELETIQQVRVDVADSEIDEESEVATEEPPAEKRSGAR